MNYNSFMLSSTSNKVVYFHSGKGMQGRTSHESRWGQPSTQSHIHTYKVLTTSQPSYLNNL